MCNDNCIYCEERQLTYDIEGATKLNTMQAEVIADLTAKYDKLVAGLESLRREHEYIRSYCDESEPCRQDEYCECGAGAHNARIDALLEATA